MTFASPATSQGVVDGERCSSFHSAMFPTRRGGLIAPLPLLLLFGAFLAAMVYLVAASLTRRTAPVFPPSPPGRVRAADWERVGDTLTVDATDGDRWRYVSLARGGVLTGADTAQGEIGIQRYRIITPPGGAIADLGVGSFEAARVTPATVWASTTAGTQQPNAVIGHWYRYNLLTHLLEPNGHVYAVRSAAGPAWKVAIVSYYCPRLEAGCLTVRYAPLPSTR